MTFGTKVAERCCYHSRSKINNRFVVFFKFPSYTQVFYANWR